MGRALSLLPRLLSAGRRVVRGAAAELFPQHDVTAGAEALATWRPDDAGAYCGRCGASAGPSAVTEAGCAACVGRPIAWSRLVRLGAYQPPLSQWIIAMKFHGVWPWAPFLGGQLAIRMPAGAAAIGASPGPLPGVAICPVPMHWLRRIRRGYNQAQLIAGAVGETRGLPVIDLLHRLRYTKPQTHLPLSRRADNVARSFGVSKVDLSGHDVWLVDDVKTSGATLSACARLLKAAGASRVTVAVIAVAEHASHPPRG